jgi:L-ascorbate metabolism protein UlaG (beta-lactamase superfamily)
MAGIMRSPSAVFVALGIGLCGCGKPGSGGAASAPATDVTAPVQSATSAGNVPAAASDPSSVKPLSVDRVPAEGGELEIRPIQHGSLLLSFAGQHIFIDPWSAGPLPSEPKADLILITDIHGDHLDPAGVAQVKGDSTIIVGPAAVAEQLPGTLVLNNGQTQQFGGVGVEAVPMYNLPRGPAEGELRHPPGRGNGYILTLGGKRVYVSGDTACTPEMKALRNIDVAFVCMNMPYTMPPKEAAECVAAFKPKVVYPYHFRGSNLTEFEQPLAQVENVEVRLRRWYP